MQTSSLLKDVQGQPLVSIIVVTYNSAKYVLETLESAKIQTYKNIELIVSDDCSTDATVDLCEKWIEDNMDQFVRTKLVGSLKNTGVTSNCNRGLKEASGEWVKLIAGDDILTADCVAQFVEHAQNEPDTYYLVGAVIPFYNGTIYKPFIAPEEFTSATAYKQHLLLLKKNCCIPGPASFIKRELINALGKFDTRFPMCEDYPFLLKVTGIGYKIHFYNFVCAKYRVHSESISTASVINNKVNPIFLQNLRETRTVLVLPLLLKNKLYFTYNHFRMLNWRNSKMGSGLNKILRHLSYLIDPLGVYIKFRSMLGLKYFYGPEYIEETDTAGSSKDCG